MLDGLMQPASAEEPLDIERLLAHVERLIERAEAVTSTRTAEGAAMPSPVHTTPAPQVR